MANFCPREALVCLTAFTRLQIQALFKKARLICYRLISKKKKEYFISIPYIIAYLLESILHRNGYSRRQCQSIHQFDFSILYNHIQQHDHLKRISMSSFQDISYETEDEFFYISRVSDRRV